MVASPTDSLPRTEAEALSLRPPALVAVAAAATAAQLALAIAFAGSGAARERWESLFQWDSVWYASIAVDGYHSTIPPVFRDPGRANVAFFPAYPFLGRAFLTFGLGAKPALLAASLASTLVFWMIFLRAVVTLGASRGAAALAAWLVFSFPTAFFMVTAYSESMFVATLLGFVVLSAREGRAVSLGAAAYGFLMTATRMVGIPVAFVALLGRRLLRGTLLAAAAVAGAASFFIWCYWRWGVWDLYQRTQAIGWDVHPSWSALVSPATWGLELPSHLLHRTLTLGKAFTALYTWLLAAAAGWEVSRAMRGRPASLLRLRLLAAAAVVQAISVVGLASKGFVSMSRYELPVHALLVLWTLLAYRDASPALGSRVRVVAASVLLAGGLGGAILQAMLVRRFTHGVFVA